MPDVLAPRRPLRRRFALPAMIAAWLVGAHLLIAADAPPVAPLPGGGPSDGCTIWFVGSSTIARWDTLTRDFAPWTVRNRGIGGAEFPQLDVRLAAEPRGDRPAAIVLYAGENDIAAGVDAATTVTRFRHFMATKSRRFGGLPVIAVSLKPGPARWRDRPAQIAYDRVVARLAAARRDLSFVDIRPAMLRQGRPGPFYVADGIHMNAGGYAIWTAALRPAIARILPATCARPAP